MLHESELTRVVRVFLAGGMRTVIRKEPLGPGAAQRVRHESAILHRLADVEGVSHLADGSRKDVLMLEDAAGLPLADVASAAPFRGVDLVDFGLAMAGILAAMHRHGVVHKDINPTKLVVSGTDRRPTLIDFHLASTFAEDRPDFMAAREITGTLSYLAPEQTGRTGRPLPISAL